MNTKSIKAFVLISTTMLAGSAFADGDALSVSGQDLGVSVTIDSVEASENGFVVIHDIVDGKPVAPSSIGHTYITAGKHENVRIPLDKVPSGKALAMLHKDTGKLGVYEFGPDNTNDDLPVMVNDKPVVQPFDVN